MSKERVARRREDIAGDDLDDVLWDQRQDLLAYVISFAVIGRFSSQVLGDHGGDSAAIVLYAINLSGATLVGMLMSADARRAGLSKMPEEEARVGPPEQPLSRVWR